MKRRFWSWMSFGGKKLLLGTLMLVQMVFACGAAASFAAESQRIVWLQGECYALSLPEHVGPLRGVGENMVRAPFTEDDLTGLLLISASPLAKLKASLQEAGVPMTDWLIRGITGEDHSAMVSIGQLAKAAGFQGAAVEDAGARKALVYEVASADAPTAMAICVQDETVISVQVSLSGAEDFASQRQLAKQAIAGLRAKTAASYALGKRLVRMPSDWELQGADGSSALGFHFAEEGAVIDAVICVIPLGQELQGSALSGSDKLSSAARDMLEPMSIKLLNAGLTADDGLVRLYDASADGLSFWIALLVDQDAVIVCGAKVQGENAPGGRETIELLVRGLGSMSGSGRTLAAVAEN